MCAVRLSGYHVVMSVLKSQIVLNKKIKTKVGLSAMANKVDVKEIGGLRTSLLFYI